MDPPLAQFASAGPIRLCWLNVPPPAQCAPPAQCECEAAQQGHLQQSGPLTRASAACLCGRLLRAGLPGELPDWRLGGLAKGTRIMASAMAGAPILPIPPMGAGRCRQLRKAAFQPQSAGLISMSDK